MKKIISTIAFAACLGFGMNAMVATDSNAALKDEVKQKARDFVTRIKDKLPNVIAADSGKSSQISGIKSKAAHTVFCTAAGETVCGAGLGIGAIAYLVCDASKVTKCVAAAKGKFPKTMGKAETIKSATTAASDPQALLDKVLALAG